MTPRDRSRHDRPRRDPLDGLLERARDDAPGRVDVTHRVMQRLATEGDLDGRADGTPTRLQDLRARRALLVCAGVSAAAAAVVAAVTLPLWLAYEDPLVGFLQAIGTVSP